MKYILFIFVAGMLAFFSTSCYDDQGSYDYHDINEIVVSNWPEDGYTAINNNDTLRITPQWEFDSTSTEPYIALSMDDGRDTSRYEYIWEVQESEVTSEDQGTVISRERNLVYPVNLPPTNYYIFLKIRDKETGLLWISNTTLRVSQASDRGYLFLGEKEDGTVGLDMVSTATDTIILKNMLDNCGIPVLKGPRRVMYTGYYYRGSCIWVTADNGAYFLDPNTMQSSEYNTFSSVVFAAVPMPDVLIPLDMASRQRGYNMNGSYRFYATEDYIFGGSITLGESYGNPLNRYSATSMDFFKPYPYIFNDSYNVGSFVVYDETNHCFAYFTRYSSSNVTRLEDKSALPFPWQQPEGRELIYGENTWMSGTSTYLSMALLEDDENFYVYHIMCASSPTKSRAYTIPKSNVPNMHAGQLFAFAGSRTLLLYAEGSTLYAYDYENELSYSKDMGDEITCMEFDYMNNLDEIMIATYNAAEQGIVQRFQLENNNLRAFELTPLHNCRWSGLVKVKDMDVRLR